MNTSKKEQSISAGDHARAMGDYMRAGTGKALALDNRGPIRYTKAGKVDTTILNRYWKYGFYVFQNVIQSDELSELRQDVDRVISEAPIEPSVLVQGLPAATKAGIARPPYRFAKPLSDPLGGTTRNRGRHPVKMSSPVPTQGSPSLTMELLHGNLHLMDSCLRLYGHPDLLAVAEAVNGPDFVPYNEVTFLKEPGLGPSVAWHQDGATHWGAADWDEGAHGFNFMIQLYPSTAGNGVWVVPGSHKMGKVNISKLVEQSGSERIEGGIPMICDSGDVIISNRQLVHGSFANSSRNRRVTLNEGFFPFKRVVGVETSQLDGESEQYTKERIHDRSRIIELAINARKQHFRNEKPFTYKPFVGSEEDNLWCEKNRLELLENYNLKDIYI